MEQGHFAWLPFFGVDIAPVEDDPARLARAELELGLKKLGRTLPVALENKGTGEHFGIHAEAAGYRITGGVQGLLYGVYRLLMALSAGRDPRVTSSAPYFALRMINHWDQMSGVVERGYAGDSLFFRDGRFKYDTARLRRYARLLCSVGVNVICVNNVNVHTPADLLILPEGLPDLAQAAALFRPFGIRLLVAVDYSLPTRHGLTTADPLDPGVQAWWEQTVDGVYQAIPDLCGFLVKADSENRPGPYMYGRDHAQGAGLLSKPLKQHGGVLVWRCFVYNCKQDWRDRDTDRPKAAYEHYAYLDGQFDDNVILQVKNGPFDFQVREPVSPLLLAMPRTVKALEVQLAQEYTGHQIDLFFMPPQWEDILRDLGGAAIRHISAVSNLGNDMNWTGHALAQANLYAYGRMAWDGAANAQESAEEWIRLTYGLTGASLQTLMRMLLTSRDIYEQYTAPLGVCWMVNTHVHYGAQPEGYEYTAWGTYLRTTHTHLGTDRTASGTGFILQYPQALQEAYRDPATCDEKLLLFFHRLPYTYRMRDGRTVIQRIYDDHFEGAARAEALCAAWASLEGRLPEDVYKNVRERLLLQKDNAREWCDIVNTYYHRYSLIDDEKRRVIYA